MSGVRTKIRAAALLALGSFASVCVALMTRQHKTSSHRSYDVRDAEKSTNHDVDFERSDMHIGVIAVLAVGVLFYVCLAPFVLTRIYRPALNDANRQLTINPPAPKLQLDAPADLAALDAREATQLASYGWVDRAKGIAHIPLAQAMLDVAAHGIPDFPKAPQ